MYVQLFCTSFREFSSFILDVVLEILELFSKDFLDISQINLQIYLQCFVQICFKTIQNQQTQLQQAAHKLDPPQIFSSKRNIRLLALRDPNKSLHKVDIGLNKSLHKVYPQSRLCVNFLPSKKTLCRLLYKSLHTRLRDFVKNL